MEKYIYDNSNGLWYELQGDYYIPCLVLPDTEERSIGILNIPASESTRSRQ